MRSKMGLSWIFGLMVLLIAFATPGNAAEALQYLWSGKGVTSTTDEIAITSADPDATSSGFFGVSSSTGAGFLAIIGLDTTVNSFIVSNSISGYEGIYVATFKKTTQQIRDDSDNLIGDALIVLGNAAEFTFKFSTDGASNFYDTYTKTSFGITHSLAEANTDMRVSVTTSAIPSAVPIPGSALLLGSSLLGLVGFSTRKKKA